MLAYVDWGRDLLTSDHLAKYLRYCRIYGVRSATRLALRRLQKPKGAPPIDVAPLCLTSVPQSSPCSSPLSQPLSIVIPTRNAGPEIELLIRKLRAQEGVPQPEIILVDSGSTDETLAIARNQNVQTLQLAPGTFTHSFSRNTGAERARGKYLLFMVQDALPLTRHWLEELVTALERNDLAAVSCAEYPRSDSDLFYQFLIHNQYEVPPLNQDREMVWSASCSSYLGLRANAQLSDIAVLFRRDVFEHYRYRRDYAEDLDLGIRLIRDGHKLGFLYNTRVLHSHNRPAYYFLKRGYVDVRYLADVFPNFVYPEIENSDRLYADICLLYNAVGKLARNPLLTRVLGTATRLIDSLRACLTSAEDFRETTALGCDPKLVEFLAPLCRMVARTDTPSSIQRSMLFPHVSDHIVRFETWLRGIYPNQDETLNGQIVAAVEKIFALHCGNHLAYLYLTRMKLGSLDDALAEMNQTLVEGV